MQTSFKSGVGDLFKNNLSNLKISFSKISNFLNKELSAKNAFLLLFILYSLALLSILRENISYRDDIGRSEEVV